MIVLRLPHRAGRAPRLQPDLATSRTLGRRPSRDLPWGFPVVAPPAGDRGPACLRSTS